VRRGFLFCAAAFALASCKPGAGSPGALVKVDYSLEVDGKLVDQSEPGKPFAFRIGAGDVVPGFEKGVLGIKPGEAGTVTVSPEDGYGLRDPTAIQALPLTAFGELAKDLAVGRSVQGVRGGKAADGVVVAMSSGTVTLDFNHPLSGKTLVFKIRRYPVEPGS
jgi:FKBP-type peptidyl-prolyl cis-trans isomerase SlpA